MQLAQLREVRDRLRWDLVEVETRRIVRFVSIPFQHNYKFRTIPRAWCFISLINHLIILSDAPL